LNQQEFSALIWSVADLLCGDYKQPAYGRVILPFTVLRRLDCVLAPTKEVVVTQYLKLAAEGTPHERFVLRTAGEKFFNVSSLTLSKLLGDVV